MTKLLKLEKQKQKETSKTEFKATSAATNTSADGGNAAVDPKAGAPGAEEDDDPTYSDDEDFPEFEV